MKNYFILMLLLSSQIFADENFATLRNAEISIEPDAPRMGKVENKDQSHWGFVATACLNT